MTSTSSLPSASVGTTGSEPIHRYHFNLTGYIKEVLTPHKAVVHFKLNGKEERGLLLSKMFYVNGKTLDEIMKPNQTIGDFLKHNDVLVSIISPHLVRFGNFFLSVFPILILLKLKRVNKLPDTS